MIPPLDSNYVHGLVKRALAEDLKESGDITTLALIPPGRVARARIEVRQAGVVAGLAFVVATFRQVDSSVRVTLMASDGDTVAPLQVLAELEGSAGAILTGERTVLNFLGHLSGIATATRQLVEAVAGTRAAIIDTRKTTPGLRVAEKYAVVCGGGRNHRIGLFDAVLIKDNHLAAVGSIAEAVARARTHAPAGVKIEVEVERLDQLREAMEAGAETVMLDNMSPDQMQEAVAIRDEAKNEKRKTKNDRENAGGDCLLEASGGITLANVRNVAESGVDLISVGWITHSAPNLDVALEIEGPR